jgi:hypothetical protein
LLSGYFSHTLEGSDDVAIGTRSWTFPSVNGVDSGASDGAEYDVNQNGTHYDSHSTGPFSCRIIAAAADLFVLLLIIHFWTKYFTR